MMKEEENMHYVRTYYLILWICIYIWSLRSQQVKDLLKLGLNFIFKFWYKLLLGTIYTIYEP